MKNTPQKESKRESQEEIKEELTNFQKIDIEILIKQNKCLLNELNRLKGDVSKEERNLSLDKCSIFSRVFTLKNHLRSFCTDLVHILEEWRCYAGGSKFIESFLLFFHELFQYLPHFLEYGNTEKRVNDFFLEKKTELLNIETQLKDFLNNLFKQNGFNHEDKKFSIIEKLNKDLTNSKHELEKELIKIKTESTHNNTENFKNEIEELKWKNSILEKRLSFYQIYKTKEISQQVELLKEEDIFFCYCGGKYFEEIPNFINIDELKENLENNVEKIKKSLPDNKSLNSQIVSTNMISMEEHESVINNLKKEIEEIIQISEKRRVDKLSLSEKILSSEFFAKIQISYKECVDYLRDLEKKYFDLLEKMVEFDFIRKKELDEYKALEKKEKKRLEKIIQDLKLEKDSFLKNQEFNKKIKAHLESHLLIEHKPTTYIEIIEKLNLQIKTITENILENYITNSKIKEEENYELKKKIEIKENNSVLGLEIQNRELRHKQHKQLFEIISKRFHEDKKMLKNISNLETYVKMRERKIKGIEKDFEQIKKELESEKLQTGILLHEISNGSELYNSQQNMINKLKNEVDILTTNFNTIFKEKNEENKKNSFKINELGNTIRNLEEDIEAKTIKINLVLNTIKKNEDMLLFEKNKNSELMNLIEKLIKEKTETINQIETLKIELDLLEKRKQALEESNEKLSKEISANFILLNEKEIIIKNILDNTNNFKMDSGDDQLNNHQKEQFYLNLLELKRLRKIVECKACKVKQKEVILTTCFHTFCHECIEKNIQDRSRKCPICLTKFNKFEVEKIFID